MFRIVSFNSKVDLSFKNTFFRSFNLLFSIIPVNELLRVAGELECVGKMKAL